MEGTRQYWSERQGRGIASHLSGEQVRRLYASLVSDLEARDRLQEHFGYECVDEGDVPGSLGSAIPERLLLILGREDVWPITTQLVLSWDDDTLFDVIEFLHDHVSIGDEDSGRYHSYAGCGWHFSHFEPLPAQREYRERVNELLVRLSPGFILTERGTIVRTAPSGLAPLLESATQMLDQENRDHVQAAIDKYRARGGTVRDRRDAVRDLADVMENMRSQFKEQLPTKDEALLFEMANKFWIRHNKPDERRDYDHEAWFAWLFYVYLASIALVSHLHERSQAQEGHETTGA